MSGNAWEWCSDWYGDYPSGSQTNPNGPPSGSYRVIRGGAFDRIANNCRVSYRSYSTLDFGYDGIFGYDGSCNIGFRIIRTE